MPISRINWQDFIVIDPEIHHGKPCIKGTRVPLAILVGSIADGIAIDEVLQEYTQLTQEDRQAALDYVP
jgi:uncharacterized protein (DUF433 family)